jgi:hypothetical protein
MNISVKITVGCKVMVIPHRGYTAIYQGTVQAITGDTYDVLIDGNSRNIHISQITVFTFGGVWMPNRRHLPRRRW